jgi:hypothetical protein
MGRWLRGPLVGVLARGGAAPLGWPSLTSGPTASGALIVAPFVATRLLPRGLAALLVFPAGFLLAGFLLAGLLLAGFLLAHGRPPVLDPQLCAGLVGMHRRAPLAHPHFPAPIVGAHRGPAVPGPDVRPALLAARLVWAGSSSVRSPPSRGEARIRAVRIDHV